MAYYDGNQYLDALNAVDFSDDAFEQRFATINHNDIGHAGAYGTVPSYVPTNRGVYNAPLQQIPMGYSGLAPPFSAGVINSQQMRLPVAQHSGTQGVSTAYGPMRAPMPYGMHQSMPTPISTTPLHPPARSSMVSGPQHAPQPASMQMSPAGAYQTGIWAPPMRQAVSEQRPAQVSAPTQMGYGATFNAPSVGNTVMVPAPRVPAPAEVIDLTNDDDDEHVGPAPTTASSVPAIQHAGTKRKRADGTSKKSSKPTKKPRYTRMEASALPTPPRSSPAVQSLPSSSPSSSSSAEALPVTPSPVKQQPTPRKKRADPHNLLGSFHYTYIQKPVNHQLAGSGAEETEKIARPVYSGYVPTPQRKRASKKPKTPEPAVVPPAATDDESDAEFELDDDYTSPTAVEPRVSPLVEDEEPVINSGSDCLTTSPAEEGEDGFEQIAFDDDGNVIRRRDGLPMSLSEWEAQQAATKETAPEFDELVLEPSFEANTITPGEPAQRTPSPHFGPNDADDLGDFDDAALHAALSKALAAADGKSGAVDEDDEPDGDDEDDENDDDGADLHAALTEAFEAEEREAGQTQAEGEFEAEEFQAEESDGEISEDES